MTSSESRSQIGFEQAGLGSVLKHNRVLVPANQREYSWDREVKQLFTDYARAINETSYFLGTIVTIPHDDDLEVVDGQQRLATTAILLAAIRDHLRDMEEVLVESINNEFLTGIDRGRRARVSKLRLNFADAELFNWIVTSGEGDPQPAPTRTSHRRMLAAYAEAKRHVRAITSPFDAKDHGDLLNTWVSFIEHRALVVVLRIPNDSDAYKMFETLNDRGLRTSQADLIKNYLFGRASERITEVQSRWAFMQGILETLDDEDITVTFLRHALIVQRGHLRESEVFDTVQEIVRSEQASVTFVAALEGLANAYVASFNPEHERWNGYPDAARRAIEVLNLLNIKPLRPLILAIGSNMSPENAAESLQFLVSLGVRLLIATTTRSGSVEEAVAEAAKDTFVGSITTAAELKAALHVTPTDRVFQEALSTARVSNAKLARYYLRSLEMAAKGESEPWFIPQGDRSVINLEHILPQKPEDNWPQFNDDELALYSKRLGNVALIRASDNSELRSDSFEDKKAVYAASPYILTSQIAEAAEWTSDAIVERQKQLADLGVAAWPV